ncbi:magnesium-dependent phosphatase-1 [Rickenella mellea]|uniref:Magnesium-dependent phosphatase-1 n=1 Tax=Rickenella mellea TaxID=50990 RepID=A0A4Y7PT46_9AGAM|nr:magnesium-dependent phosphatase-1 [Rickenella mellea]
MGARYPQLIAFDLDYTLWDLWIDTHVTGPLRREGKELNNLYDRYGQEMSFYPDVPQILHRVRAADVKIAACSRTAAIRLAREALSLLLLPPPKSNPGAELMTAIEFFDHTEIYPTSKIVHFKELHKKTGIPYSEMLFFDDEHRNIEVESLGVTFCLVENGMDENVFDEGIKEWRRRQEKQDSE